MEKRQPPKKESQRPDSANSTSKCPNVSGQRAQVLEYLRKRRNTESLHLTADLAIPETAARVHELRAMGFNILTIILPEFEFRGRIRRNVARYVLGAPEWFPPAMTDDSVQGGLF